MRAFVAHEAVVGARRHVDRLALAQIYPFALDLERATALEQLAVLVVFERPRA